MRNPFSALVGILLVFVGLAFLFDNLDIIDAEWFFKEFWPFALIVFGVSLLLWRKPTSSSGGRAGAMPDRPGSTPGTFSPKNYVSASEVFSDLKIQNSSKNFAGGQCSVVFGDIMLDLREIDLLSGEQVLRLNGVFGSIRVDLPEAIEYCVKASVVAGNVLVKGDSRGGLVLNETIQSKGFVYADRRLMIHASSVFGKIKVF